MRQRHQQLLAENEGNPHPIRATFRLDSGFASQENITVTWSLTDSDVFSGTFLTDPQDQSGQFGDDLHTTTEVEALQRRILQMHR